jgi:osmotically-inducible protein OsmY
MSWRTEEASLAERAENRLRCNSYLALKNVHCEAPAEADVVVLRGCLPTYYLKQVAQTVVAAVDGVRRVENRIQVVAPAPRGPHFD